MDYLLIQQIIDGVKTATCSFKVLYSENELSDLYQTYKNIVTVVNKQGVPKCNIRITDIFETTFGNPELRLVSGEGYGENFAQFQADHTIAWQSIVKDTKLNSDSILIVELFELMEVI